eukprot:CAMPEP_0202088260 /NCGR_PEP_ID=MMETSP0964-20121228/38230_1 /ASSEMBLY_ACC=CAM_ASM_000500 /TAXON_ID=4773 /ORGANISM="Schizochytrium aggregatum, Strain ATCC28209" /LENGTH=47 /DNA_ID= /DNA_START= /DNA_END= /DNA_ORIENTATION=
MAPGNVELAQARVVAQYAAQRVDRVVVEHVVLEAQHPQRLRSLQACL